MAECNAFVHYSIDDVILVFYDLTTKHPKSIFDIEMFSFFRKLHQRYGLVLSCYCFFARDSFSLEKCVHSYKQEFEENASWLKFGFHGYNESTDYNSQNVKSSILQYEAFVHEMKQIVGEKSLDLIPRIHGFKASREFVSYLANNGCLSLKGLLSADDDRISYSLSIDDDKYLKLHRKLWLDDMIYLRTLHRFESLRRIGSLFAISASGGEFFTHEWVFYSSRNIKMMVRSKIVKVTMLILCEYYKRRGIGFAFPMDKYK